MGYIITYFSICIFTVAATLWYKKKYGIYGNVKFFDNKRIKIEEQDRIELYKILCRIFSYRPCVFEPSSKDHIGFTAKNASEFTIHYHSDFSGLLKNCSPVKHNFNVVYLKSVNIENVFQPIQNILRKYISKAKTC